MDAEVEEGSVAAAHQEAAVAVLQGEDSAAVVAAVLVDVEAVVALVAGATLDLAVSHEVVAVAEVGAASAAGDGVKSLLRA